VGARVFVEGTTGNGRGVNALLLVLVLVLVLVGSDCRPLEIVLVLCSRTFHLRFSLAKRVLVDAVHSTRQASIRCKASALQQQSFAFIQTAWMRFPCCKCRPGLVRGGWTWEKKVASDVRHAISGG
jgi:hypothetical protein